MRRRVAPSCANLFMGSFKEEYIYGIVDFKSNIVLYKRFKDDFIFIWRGDLESIMKFVNEINNNNWGIILTLNFNEQTTEFFDLLITQKNNGFCTATYFKSIDTNSYLDFKSNHHRSWKKNIPFGQLWQIRKNCTLNSTFERQAAIIKKCFAEKGYPKHLVTEAYRRVKGTRKKKYLGLEQTYPQTTTTNVASEQKTRLHNSSTPNFITTFNSSHLETWTF